MKINEKYLKRAIGIVYLTLAFSLIGIASKYNCDQHVYKFIWIIGMGAIGIGIRAYVYFGICKSSDNILDQKAIRAPLMSYFVYYLLALLSICSLAFFIYYQNITSMTLLLFQVVSFFLFGFIGFFINDMAEKLQKWLFSRNQS